MARVNKPENYKGHLTFPRATFRSRFKNSRRHWSCK